MPPCTFGCKVFTRPSSIAGNPVKDSTCLCGMFSACNNWLVPPVEMSSTPKATKPLANSAKPDLSETDNNARFTGVVVMMISQSTGYKVWLIITRTKANLTKNYENHQY